MVDKVQIETRCVEQGHQLSSQQYQLLADFVDLLDKWNQTYNLTAVRDKEHMVERHIVDSLSLLPYLSDGKLLDIGTGAGLPGIPLAIARPDIRTTLVDSNAKKTRFLQQVKAELALDNINIIHGRIEKVLLTPYEMVTARAFATVAEMINMAGHHCIDGGQMLLMKGNYPETELMALPADFQQQIIQLNTPTDAARHLVILQKMKTVKR